MATEVVAALIWDGNRFMICQRPAHKTRGRLWEFVGGKVEAGESKEQALVRECQEELGVTVSVGEVFWEVLHEYPDMTVHLTLFHASIAEGTPKKLEHEDIRWITTEEIPDYDFCPADVEILERLKSYKRGLPLQNKVVVVTGGAHGIGKTICEEFRRQGAVVCMIDKEENDFFVGDIAEESVLRSFVEKVLEEHGSIDYLINNAMLSRGGLENCSYEDFNYVLRVGVSAPFLLAKLFAEHFRPGAAIVNISSSRDRMSQPNTESYTAAKGGISALTHALAVTLAGKARVNSISPGWIDTEFQVYQGADAVQQPVGRVGNPMDIANMVLFLCSEKAGFITGENICVDGGMTHLMIYHNDFGWTYQPNEAQAH